MGTALPSHFNFPKLALKEKMFRPGRAKINDYVIRESVAERGVQALVHDCHE